MVYIILDNKLICNQRSNYIFVIFISFITLLSFIVDKYKYRSIVIPSNLLNLCHALTFQFIIKNKILYIIYYFMSGIFNSIEIVATFPHLLKVFGHKIIVIILGVFCIGTFFISC